MRDAFGVDREQVSKGLPSALRSGAFRANINGADKGQTWFRLEAHKYGRALSRKGKPGMSNENLRNAQVLGAKKRRAAQ